MGDFRRLGEREVHRGNIWRVVVADFESPDGDEFRRDIVRSPGAVGVVPLVFDAEGTAAVVLLRQYRPTVERVLVEIPAGMRDVDGEAPEATAHRELGEEVGLRAERLDLLIELLPAAGMTDAVTTIYLGTGCGEVDRDVQGPEERHSEVVRIPLDEAVAMVEAGEITDAKTVAGILLTARRVAGGDRG